MQFPVQQLPGLLGGLELGLKTVSVVLTQNVATNLTAGMALASRKLLLVYNPNASSVLIGDVTGQVFPIAPGQTMSFEFYKGKAFNIYGLTTNNGWILTVAEGG